jgi:hypothetical protein
VRHKCDLFGKIGQLGKSHFLYVAPYPKEVSQGNPPKETAVSEELSNSDTFFKVKQRAIAGRLKI